MGTGAPCAQAIAAAGGLQLLKGLQRFGGVLKDATSDLLKGVSDPASLTVEVDTAAHARQAHQTRLKHSKVCATALSRARTRVFASSVTDANLRMLAGMAVRI